MVSSRGRVPKLCVYNTNCICVVGKRYGGNCTEKNSSSSSTYSKKINECGGCVFICISSKNRIFHSIVCMCGTEDVLLLFVVYVCLSRVKKILEWWIGEKKERKSFPFFNQISEFVVIFLSYYHNKYCTKPKCGGVYGKSWIWEREREIS